MNKKILALLMLAVLAGTGVRLMLSGEDIKPGSNTAIEKKAAHYESNTPATDSVLPLPLPNVTIDFNFDLAAPSKIEILKDSTDYGEGETTIDDNKLVMRRGMKHDAPDGTYIVKYDACWPDGSCHDGQFNFRIDRSLVNGYMDMRNQSEVTVKMSQIKFAPMELRISKGTKVTWVNDDEVAHYVNTDSHPAHTHILDLNSMALNKGDSYSYTFNKIGSHPYHCSAHAHTMSGTIIVE